VTKDEDREAEGEEGEGAPRAKRRLRSFFIAALVVGLLLWVVVSFLQEGRTAPSGPAARTASSVSTPRPAGPGADPRESSPPASAERDEPSLPEDDPVALYRAQTRYAPTSGVLAPTAVDLIEPNRRYESFVAIGDTVDRGRGEEIRFLFTADKYYYEGDERVNARLEVQRSGTEVPITIELAEVEAEGGSGRIGEAKPLEFEPQGGAYAARIDLAEDFPEHHGPLRLQIRFSYGPEQSQQAELRVFTTPVSDIPGRFLGRYRDGVVSGSLLVEAAVEIFDAGFYRFDANLFANDGAPLAFANFKGPLEPGLQWIPLEFFGLLLIDLGASGPWQVRNLRGYRFLDGNYPDRLRLRDATMDHWTHAYELASFSQDEFTDPQKERMLEMLEQDALRGIALDLPEVANGP